MLHPRSVRRGANGVERAIAARVREERLVLFREKLLDHALDILCLEQLAIVVWTGHGVGLGRVEVQDAPCRR
jgi:hypothetical protein